MPEPRHDRRRESMPLLGPAVAAVLVLSACTAAWGQVRPPLASTKHNLLPGAPASAKMPELCTPCHSPAGAKPADGPFTGASAQCVACHKAMAGMPSPKPDAAPAGHHPVSFVYDQALAAAKGLTDPAKLPKTVRLDKAGRLQCTSCHEPHDNMWGKFLVGPTARGACASPATR